MSDDDGARIDPRYDAAFQRGFSGEVTTGPRGQSTLRRTAAVNPAPTRPAPQRLGPQRLEPQRLEPPRVEDLRFASAGPPAAESVAPGSPTFVGVPDAASAPAAQPAADPVPVTTPRELARNPFVIALAALGAALIIAGAVWAYEGFATIVKNGGTRNEVEFWAAQTMSFGAPLAIVAGLTVVAALLVLFGQARQRSRT